MSLFKGPLDAFLRNHHRLHTLTLAISLPIGALGSDYHQLTSERQPETKKFKEEGPRTDLNRRPIHWFRMHVISSYGLRKKARLWQKKINWTWNCWEVSSTKLREREVCAAIETAVYEEEERKKTKISSLYIIVRSFSFSSTNFSWWCDSQWI